MDAIIHCIVEVSKKKNLKVFPNLDSCGAGAVKHYKPSVLTSHHSHLVSSRFLEYFPNPVSRNIM